MTADPYSQPQFAPPPAPKRPWYKKKRYLIPLALLVLLILAGALGSSEPDDATSAGDNTASESAQTTTPPAAEPAPTTEAPAPPPPAPPAETRPNDAGLVVESFTVTSEYGICQIDLRVTNTNDTPESGGVTVTAFKGGQVLDTTNGFFNDVAAGDTFSVQAIGTKECGGADTIDFERSF